MPSVTDIQQQSSSSTASGSNIHGKATPPPQQQVQQPSADSNNADPLSLVVQAVEKKQRNLGKRKEKLEGYQKEAKDGKELHKDQVEALAKYPEVIGQIESLKELLEQFKKIQTDAAKNQKRLLKQAAEEKRSLVSERLREYALVRYLFDNRTTTMKPEESAVLDALSGTLVPSDNSSSSISNSVDAFLTIYHGGSPSTIKSLTGKSPQEVREIFERVIQNLDNQKTSASSSVTAPVEEPQQQQQQQQPQQQQQQQQQQPIVKENNEEVDIQPATRSVTEYPLQFDTRTQNIPLDQIIQNSPFFSNDLNNQPVQEPTRDQSPDPKQYLQTRTIVNSNINDQTPSTLQSQQQEDPTNVVTSSDDQQQHGEDQWQHQRGNGYPQRGGQHHNGNGNKTFNRGGQNTYGQSMRPQRGGVRHDNPYGGGGQRQFNENNRGRNGPNPNYRGNRGGNYRGANRGYQNNANGYQKPQYQQNNDQRQQVRSAPSSQQQ